MLHSSDDCFNDIDRFLARIFALHLQKFVRFLEPLHVKWPCDGGFKDPGTSSWSWNGGFEHPVTSSWPWNCGSEDLGTSSWPWNGGFEGPWTASWPWTGDFDGPGTSSWRWNGDQNPCQVASMNEKIGFSLCCSCAKHRRSDFQSTFVDFRCFLKVCEPSEVPRLSAKTGVRPFALWVALESQKTLKM